MAKPSDESVQISPIEEYYTLREKRLALQREAAALEAKERVLAYELFKNPHLPPEGYTFSKWEEDVPFVEDWPAFLDYIRDTDALDCLQKRLTNSAIMARLKDDVDIPGVKIIKKPNVKVEKQ